MQVGIYGFNPANHSLQLIVQSGCNVFVSNSSGCNVFVSNSSEIFNKSIKPIQYVKRIPLIHVAGHHWTYNRYNFTYRGYYTRGHFI